jgi:hypothetical protein
MRFLIGFLSGVLGMLAGWSGLAVLVISLAGPDRDGGLAMGAFFNIGPIGGFFGFIAGVLLFIKLGIAKAPPSSDATKPSDAAPAQAPARTRVSPIFAGVVVVIAAVLGWWGWYEFIRSPYLSHGYMTLNLQFKLPPGMALPPEATDMRIAVEEGQRQTYVSIGTRWRGTEGDRRVILATASLSYKTSRRVVTLEFPGVAAQTWQIDLPSDPDPTPGYSPWRLASGTPAQKIEMNFSLTADH